MSSTQKQHVPIYLPPAEGFLEPDRVDAGAPEKARAVVIPFGLEASVSYGSGTAAGPAAILKASHQLELYDDELDCEPNARFGVATLAPVTIARAVEPALAQLEGLVENLLVQGKFPLVLGGEHSLTPGAIRPFVTRYPDLVVLQLDAHADLRDGYQGEPYSHAAAMRRVLDHKSVTLVSVGIRGLSLPEAEFARANTHRIHMHYARDQARYDLDAIMRPLRGKPVYVTFDIDALDPSVMPATGTPVPGGLSYELALALLRAAANAGTIVGADLVEFAPIAGLHHCDYTAAALAYKMLMYALVGTVSQRAATLEA